MAGAEEQFLLVTLAMMRARVGERRLQGGSAGSGLV
jgi:hypothetical protein